MWKMLLKLLCPNLIWQIAGKKKGINEKRIVEKKKKDAEKQFPTNIRGGGFFFPSFSATQTDS